MSTNTSWLIILIFFFINFLSASGGYDIGTSTGKGKIQVDLTWNPNDRIEFGQTYAVMSYGITDRLDIHSYLAHHTEGFETWYAGVFYQFLDQKRLDLATAVGIRKRFNQNWTHLFFPQLLYTIHFSEKIYLGGSLVNVINDKFWKRVRSLGVTVDFAVFFKLPYHSKWIENVAVGFGWFHPVTHKPNNYFLPTYSVDILFRKLI